MRYLLTIVLSLILFSAHAQDLIVKKNGEEIKAKILEVTSTEIRFKLIDNANGPVYTFSKSEIFMVKYENGMKEVFGNTSTNTPSSQPQPYSTPTNVIPQLPQKIQVVGGKYYQNGIKLSDNRLYRTLLESPQDEVKKSALDAQKTNKAANPLIIMSIPFMSFGFVLGGLSSLVISSIDNKTNSALGNYTAAQIQEVRDLYQGMEVFGFALGGIGAGCLVAGITIKSNANKKTLASVALYNQTIDGK